MYAGIDLGLKRSGLAVIRGCEAEVLTVENSELPELLSGVKVAAVDAPLSYGDVWRDCDRAVMWAKPLPLNLPSMRALMHEGIKLKEELESTGIAVIESFSNALRKLIQWDLGYVLNKEPNEHERDALLLAFVAFLHRYGGAEAFGKECSIWLPRSEVLQCLKVQNSLKDKVRIEKPGKIEGIAGVDVSYKGGKAYAAAVVLKGNRVMAENVVEAGVNFPYIPGFLAARELKPVIKALAPFSFDAVAVNAQGLGHPRLGLASHIGIVLNRPSAGVSRALVCGNGGSKIHYAGREVGFRLDGYYLTIGHRFDMDSLERYARTLIRAVELAHHLASEASKNI